MAYRNGDFQILDFSTLIEIVPRIDQLITNMNLFTPHYLQTTIAQVERIDEGVKDIKATRRGGVRQYVGSERVRLKNFNVPFFPLDRQITAGDIQNFRMYGTENVPQTVEAEVIRVLKRLNNYFMNLKEKAMFATLMGYSYDGGDTRSQYNYYDEWGVDQVQADVDFTQTLIDPTEIIEKEARAFIIDNAGDNGNGYEIMVIASRKWFSALIAHPLVVNAFTYYPSSQEPLRRRLGGNANNRVFEYKNILFIEDISGNVPDGEAYIFPRGIENMFSIHYSPADTIEEANHTAREMYVWYKESAYHRERKIEAETSFLTTNQRPELVVRSVGTFA